MATTNHYNDVYSSWCWKLTTHTAAAKPSFRITLCHGGTDRTFILLLWHDWGGTHFTFILLCIHINFYHINNLIFYFITPIILHINLSISIPTTEIYSYASILYVYFFTNIIKFINQWDTANKKVVSFTKFLMCFWEFHTLCSIFSFRFPSFLILYKWWHPTINLNDE